MSADRVVWGHGLDHSCELWSGLFRTREEAIADGRSEYRGDPFYVRRGRQPMPSEFAPSADDMIEIAEQRAHDNCYEVAEGWPDIARTDPRRAELRKLVADWFDLNCPVLFWMADDDSEPELIEPEEGAQ